MAKFWPFPAPVWSGSGWHQTICFLMEIHSFLGILAQKSFTGPGDAPDGQVLAFRVPVWSEVVETGIKSFVFYWESIPFLEFWLKNRFLCQGMPQMAKFWPFPAPMVSEVVGIGCKMILTTFYYTLVL